MTIVKLNGLKLQYILSSLLVAAAPFVLIPLLKSSFSETEMILYLSINTIVSIFVVFDFGLGIKIISLLSNNKFRDMNGLFAIHAFYQILSLSVGVILFGFSEYILRYISGNIDHLGSFRILLLCIPVRIYLIYLKNVSLGIGDYNQYNILSLVGALGKLACGYFTLQGFLNFESFAVLFILTQFIEVFYALKITEYLKVNVSRSLIFDLLRQHKVIFSVSIVSIISQYADRLTVPAILDPHDLENFLLAISFANVIFLALNPINQLFNVDVAEDIEKADEIIKKYLFILSAFYVFGVVLFLLMADFILIYWFNSNDKSVVDMMFVIISSNLIFHMYGLFYFYCYHCKLRVADFLVFNSITAVLFFVGVEAAFKTFGIFGITFLIFFLNSSKLLVHSFLALKKLTFYFSLYFLMVCGGFLWVF